MGSERDADRAEARAGGSRSGCGGHRRHRRHRHGGGRKERVLHTRISEQLSEDIRRLADDLRVPVSNLVRNVLEEVFDVVEEVTDDVGDLFEDILEEAEGVRDRIRRRSQESRERGAPGSRGRRRRSRFDDVDVEEELRRDETLEAEVQSPPAPPEFPDVIGWQPLILNRATTCSSCGAALSRGSRAFVGLEAGGLGDKTLCRACVGS